MAMDRSRRAREDSSGSFAFDRVNHSVEAPAQGPSPGGMATSAWPCLRRGPGPIPHGHVDGAMPPGPIPRPAGEALDRAETPLEDAAPGRGSRRLALAMSLLLAGASGCVVHPFRDRPEPSRSAPAADLLDVSALAPRLDAEKSDPAVRAPSRPRGAGPVDDSVARVQNPSSTPLPLPAVPLPAEVAPAPSALAGATPPTIPEASAPYAIDLPTALRLADDQNPEIAEARVAILAATAEQLAAYSILLPSLNAGTNYHAHTGNLIRSTGQVLNVSSQSLYVGAGARTLAAETVNIPGVNVFGALTDAIYQPLAARQRVAGARFNASATANEVLLEVSRRYLELIGARATLEAWRNSAAEADEIARVVADYFATGQGRKADADRAETERRLFQAEIQHAEELVAVASARLSEQLNLDASIRLEPPMGQVEPLTIVNLDAPTEDLIRAAVRQRPDLAARQADVNGAEFRHKRELARPLLPTVWVGFSGGYFGGGSNIVPPSMGNFGGRQDFDARLFWTVLNGGFGNVALQRQQRAEVNEAIASRVRVLNRARDEITSSRAEALVQRQMVDTARAEVASAESGYREDRIHLRESLGRPIETLNSLKLLARARVHLIEAITRANQAQFALFVALGTPPPLGPDAGPVPPGPPPVANPLGSPIVSRPVPLIPVPPPGPPLLGR